MSGPHAVVCLMLATALLGCSEAGTRARSCGPVREQAKAAAETGIRLRAEASPDSAAIETSARSYVAAVRSRPDCFTGAQRANAEEIGRALPSAPTP